MKYILEEPSPNLRAYINSIWYFENYFDDPYEMIFLPKHTHFITISFDDIAKLTFENKEEYQIAPMTLGGLLDKTSLTIKLHKKVKFIGIDLKPYGFYKLTKHSCDVFVNKNWDMGLFFKKSSVDDLYDQLCNSDNVQNSFKYIERFLIEQFGKGSNEKMDLQISKISTAIKIVTDQTPVLSIREIASELAMSERNFQRLFNTVVGVSPKSWTDKYKFQLILVGLKKGQWKTLEDAAFSNGFNDVSHFCKFFKSQTGFKPSEVIQTYGPMYNSIFQYDG
ncbi:helix-turn-helix transcriptional regulator, partial [uncultured Cytophaga sp.]|uniref:helix-turn-helix transcriptional regulator n=1 Tax=uncultured Cytophaga sp. TaxID=160238 RepID=UPI00260DA7C9